MKTTLRYVLALTLITIFCRGCIISCANRVKETWISREIEEIEEKIAVKFYLTLFRSEASKKLKTDFVEVSLSKYPFVSFGFLKYPIRKKDLSSPGDQLTALFAADYHILIHRVKLEQNNFNSGLISVKRKPVIDHYDRLYSGWDNFSFTHQNDSIAKSIIMSYDGIIVNQQNIGDSIISYNLLSKQVSFNYEPDEPADFYLGENNSSYYPNVIYNVIFYRKKSSVYLFVIEHTTYKKTDTKEFIKLLN